MTLLASEIPYLTVQLVGITPQGESIGTGFFFKYKKRLFIVTNKHVVNGVTGGDLLLLKEQTDDQNNKKPVLGEYFSLSFNSDSFIGHPDTGVDVAVMNISTNIVDAESDGHQVFWKNLAKENIPDQEDIDKKLSPIEDVLIIGYPEGMWDSRNKLSIVRRGITATPYHVNYEKRPIFLVDTEIYAGLGGSLVLSYGSSADDDGTGSLHANRHFMLLGILAATYQRTGEGEIRMTNIPTQRIPLAEISQLTNLGIVFKAETIVECIEFYIGSTST